MADNPNQYFIKQSVEAETYMFVYTENLDAVKDKKFKIEPNGTYSRRGKIIGYHFYCMENDDKMKVLFEKLGLTEADEKKLPRRKRRTKAEMNGVDN